MHIIKITGKPGSGKSEVLNELAKVYNTQVISGQNLMAAMPLLLTQTGAVAPNTFVDGVSPEMVKTIEKLTKLYDSTYRMYIAGERI